MAAATYNFTGQIPPNTEAGAESVHSVIIGGWDLYLKWHLVPESRPFFAPPEIKTQYVAVPGSDIELDYTEALTGRIHYGSRTGSWNFIAVPDGVSMMEKYKDMCYWLKGKIVFASLRDYPDYSYKGRFWISDMKSDTMYSKVTINYKVEPHPYVDGVPRLDLI